jgi:hypothetical protein
MKIDLSTKTKEETMTRLKAGAIIEHSPWFKTANMKLGEDFVGRVHMSTFNSLLRKGVITAIKENKKEDNYWYYAIVSQDETKKGAP